MTLFVNSHGSLHKLAVAGALSFLLTATASAYEDESWRFRKPPQPNGFTFGASPSAPAHLPANAKGVIFHATGPLTAADFVISQLNGSTAVPVTLVPLQGDRAAVPDAMEKLAETAERLYRVEPRGGFRAGSTYKVAYAGSPKQTLFVHIDRESVNLGDARVMLAGEPNIERIRDVEACRAAPFGVAIMQAFRIEAPAQWAPYSLSIFGMLHRADKNPWFIGDRSNSTDIAIRWDDLRARQFGQGEARHLCSALFNHGRRETAMSARLAFLEIEDRWQFLKPVNVVLDRKRIARRDSLDYLQAAQQSGNPAAIVDILRQLPIRATDEAVAYPKTNFLERLAATRRPFTDKQALQRRAQLRGAVTALAAHARPEVRAAAVQALEQMNIRHLEIEGPKAP